MDHISQTGHQPVAVTRQDTLCVRSLAREQKLQMVFLYEMHSSGACFEIAGHGVHKGPPNDTDLRGTTTGLFANPDDVKMVEIFRAYGSFFRFFPFNVKIKHVINEQQQYNNQNNTGRDSISRRLCWPSVEQPINSQWNTSIICTLPLV